jgi:hypothetical protein
MAGFPAVMTSSDTRSTFPSEAIRATLKSANAEMNPFRKNANGQRCQDRWPFAFSLFTRG